MHLDILGKLQKSRRSYQAHVDFEICNFLKAFTLLWAAWTKATELVEAFSWVLNSFSLFSAVFSKKFHKNSSNDVFQVDDLLRGDNETKCELL